MASGSTLPRIFGSAVLLSSLGFGGVLGWQYVAPRQTDQQAPLPRPVIDVEPEPTHVMTIHPKRDASLEVAVQQIASVQAFYQAMLRSRVSGVVHSVFKDIGDRVHRGEVLLEIDVPDLELEVAQKESVVVQRQRELNVFRAQLKDAQANLEVAKSAILQKQTEVTQMEAMRDLHRKRLTRYKSLAGNEAIPPDVVDEQEREAQSSAAGVEAAKVAVQRAQADLREKEVKVEVANADIDLKESLIEVARRDLERTRALADYARITAPFDGVVLRRNVHPGSFVQNASSGQSEALLTIARTDLVTIVAKFPDNVAPFVSKETEADIEIDELSGMVIGGKVTRFSPSIQNSDRTMQVEMDLFNAGEQEYARFLRKAIVTGLTPLASTNSLGAGFFNDGSLKHFNEQRKGSSDTLSARAVPRKPGVEQVQLIPGMTGIMRLRLKRFANTYVLPSGAVYSRGGKPHILLVKDGFTKQIPVQIQLNDGKLTKLSMITRQLDSRGGSREVLQELTGEEEAIPSRQVEIGDAQEVRPNLVPW